ncbi:MAG: [protein-PII] uridylyltransferase [Pseudomonadota bacterium]
MQHDPERSPDLVTGATRVSGEARPAQPDSDAEQTVAAFVDALPDASTAGIAVDLKTQLALARQALANRFLQGEAVEALVRAEAELVDAVLISLWRHYEVDSSIGLIAVGGYGRGELHPGSDVDILILLPDDQSNTDAAAQFVTALWDTGLEIGHSVRTVDECQRVAKDDVTILTTLMESRVLCGPAALHEQMVACTDREHIWDSNAFFLAKRDEQTARHARYGDTGYNLEPNLKGSPGGLRDIQMVGWIARRHFSATELEDLIHHGFLSRGQLDRILEGRHFLWTLRYGLHVLTGRREDRLLFDHQKNLAQMLGYEDARFTLGVEQMMQRYYRTVMQNSRLNEMLLQLFEERILLPTDTPPQPINDAFVNHNGYLQAVDADVFTRDPSALLEVFSSMQAHPELRGVGANTIGMIRRNLTLIDEQFRQNPRNHRLFLSIMDAPQHVTRELRRMNRYGVLGLYIPAFGRIVGRMQYDLFHAYTVDEHTLFVVDNLRQFSRASSEFGDAQYAQVMARLDKPYLAYLSGLFHDIAKGRGGDHSELGAVDALTFCREHGIDDNDAELVSWLVANHLVLSMTAQKKDISDPDVVAAFARLVGDERHLDYLYVLTAADVRGTNPKLWNSWKSKLFHDLYAATRRHLQRGLDNPIDKTGLVASTRRAALDSLLSDQPQGAIDEVWRELPETYFLRHSADEIVWHTRRLLQHGLQTPFVDVAPRTELNALAILLYTPEVNHTFAIVTARLADLGLSVLDARIEPTHNQFSLDTYIVVEEGGLPMGDDRHRDVEERLTDVIHADNLNLAVSRRAPRRQRMFNTDTKIQFRQDEAVDRTIMELTSADYPGLLKSVGEVLIEREVYIKSAKIVTIGERAEDVFFLTNMQETPLDDAHCERLRDALLSRLNAEGE